MSINRFEQTNKITWATRFVARSSPNVPMPKDSVRTVVIDQLTACRCISRRTATPAVAGWRGCRRLGEVLVRGLVGSRCVQRRRRRRRRRGWLRDVPGFVGVWWKVWAPKEQGLTLWPRVGKFGPAASLPSSILSPPTQTNYSTTPLYSNIILI